MDVEIDLYRIDILPLFGLALLVICAVLWRRTRGTSFVFCCFLFGVYMIYALKEAFFPLPLHGSYMETMKQVPFMQSVNLIPFDYGPFAPIDDILSNSLLNILLTLPFGFGISFVAPVRARQIVGLAFAVGLGIEGAQLIISLLLGYAYRIIDINDSIFNTLGVVTGYALFWLFGWVYIRTTERVNLEYVGIAAYIGNVVSCVHPNK